MEIETNKNGAELSENVTKNLKLEQKTWKWNTKLEMGNLMKNFGEETNLFSKRIEKWNIFEIEISWQHSEIVSK